MGDKEEVYELTVPKVKTVKFTRTDGRTPTRSGVAKTFNLRAPFEFKLQPNEKKTITLGLSCDHPTHLFNARGLTERDVWLVDGIWAAHDADTQFCVYIENKSKEIQYFEEGDTIAKCTVLDDSEWELA